MRITAALLALLISLVLPAVAIAENETADFVSRWPEVPMREPTLTERIRLIANVAKDDIKLIIESGLPGTQQKSWRCTAVFCQLMNSH